MNRLTRLEIWLVFALVFVLTLAIGLRGWLLEAQVNWDGLAAVAHAYDVFHAEPNANLAMIGFVQPPLPALLQLPVVLIFPALAESGLAANLLGAVCAGIAVALLLGLAADCGLGRVLRWPLVTLFALHPLVLGPAACGAPMALLTVLLMGAAWALLRWSREETLRDLIAASLVLAGALITRYEAAFIVVGALIYLAWRIRRGGGSWSKLEGTMITFALPIVYVAGIWIIANRAIMGDAWYFLRGTYEGARAAGIDEMLNTVVAVSLVAFFPVLALVYNQMRGAGRHPAPARPVAWLVLTALLAPIVFPYVFSGLADDGLWSGLLTPIAMIITGGFAMVAAMLGNFLQGKRSHVPPQGTVFMVVGSLAVAIWLLMQGLGIPGPLTRAYYGRGPLADTAASEIAAAELLVQTDLPPDRQHLVVGWPGFAVTLFAGRTGEMSVIRTGDLPQFVDTIWEGSRVVLLVGRREGGVSEAEVEAGLGLPQPLNLVQEWRAGPWVCYRVVGALQ
ncbi:MAG: glycosyltransferase family 39 protein [candidate division WS1 bacterium]|jgi:hypothetical protein|nr:glycosyltransferase family 39 protein [candidate division WS1 bacterium]